MRLLGGISRTAEGIHMERVPLTEGNFLNHRFIEMLSGDLGLSGNMPSDLEREFIKEFRAWLEKMPDKCWRKAWGIIKLEEDGGIAIYPDN